ncbi:MAG: S16 family serine protease [Candidatus Nezhaarchaeales archaeon]
MVTVDVLSNKKASTKVYVLVCILIASLALNGVLSYMLLYELKLPTSSVSTGVESGESVTGGKGVGGTGLIYLHNVTSIRIVGVVGGEYRGVVMTLQGALIEGEGQVYVSTSPKIGIELQEAAETAFRAAQKFTGVNASDLDLMLRVVSNESIYIVDGPSAGAAVAVLASSLLLGVPIRGDVVLTGTIDENGAIGQVGGILYKAEAAAKAGAKIFLVPPGQSEDTIYVVTERRVGPLTLRYYRPQMVNVEEYLRSQGYSINVVEVSSLSEAFNYFRA